MRILFASEFQHLPQSFGGVQSSTHELARELVKRGHFAAVAASLFPWDLLGIGSRMLGRLLPRRKVHDRFLGYPTYRRWNVLSALPDLVAEIRPDVAIVQPSNQVPLARELARLSVPTIVYLRDVEWPELKGDPRDLHDALFVANSRYTARRLREDFSLESTVIKPFFRPENYRTDRRGENITFINPHPLKGSDIAIQLVAACPDIPFRFIRSWDLSEEQEGLLDRLVNAHKNLTVIRPTKNMKKVYRSAKIILMPSRWEEAWGRVATEAQFSGIPVIASDRGGLPESVGPGGILLDPDGPLEPWIQAVRRLWSDDAYYAELSHAALAHARRVEINPDHQIDLLLGVARNAIQRRLPVSGRETLAFARCG